MTEIKIVSVEESPLKNKRLRAQLNTGQYIDFGLKTGSTFIDHYDISKRFNYWARHTANNRERELLERLIPSPALLSLVLLWGPYTNIDGNIEYLNRLWKEKNIK